MTLLALIQRYTAWLASHGRTDHRTIRSGETLFKHYYPLYVSRAKHGEGSTRWPNIVIHEIFNTFKPELAHDHGRYVMSFIMTGGYTEVRYRRDGSSYETVRRPGSIAFLRWDERHNIKDVLADTWTLFAFGPRFRDAHFQHPVSGKILTRFDVDRMDKKRVSGYHPASAELEVKIAKRKQSMARLQRMKRRSPIETSV